MPWRVRILWLLFLTRGAFYCVTLPLWEGWDEYAHFAWLQHWNSRGTLPDFHDPVSAEIDESMRLAPLAYELRWLGPPYLTHAKWWALPEAERAERARRLRSLDPELGRRNAGHPFDFYEAQQPPLYYWLLSLPLRLAAGWPLPERVRMVRLLSMALASGAIPLLWLAARGLLGEQAAITCAALLAVAPGFAIDVSRVANDGLAILLTGLLFWLLLRPRAYGPAMGLVLGAALLSKAYLLALVPAVILLWWRHRRELGFALAIAGITAGWWYLRNLLLGNSLSGWTLHASPWQVLTGVPRINWVAAAHVIAKSFLWFGAWSFLTLKSWMYFVLEAVALTGAILAARNRRACLRVSAVLAGAYLLAMGYGVLVYEATQHVPNLPGWYLWPVAGMLAVIVVAGLRRCAAGFVALLAAADLYGMIALLAPYYAGLVERDRAAASAFLPGLARLHVPLWLAAAWFAATLGIVAIAFVTNYEREKPVGHRYRGFSETLRAAVRRRAAAHQPRRTGGGGARRL